MQPDSEIGGLGKTPIRQRCYTCYRPVDRCFCSAIPVINNRTKVTILQHVKERFHAFNSARIVKASLQNCELHVDQLEALQRLSLPVEGRTAVLYPSEDAVVLEELSPTKAPQHLVILDGTWNHARKLIRLPCLAKLPRVRLNPVAPSNYRIRKEPAPFALSTLEATVACLQKLEPETQGWPDLLAAFNTMIEGQLQHPRQQGRERKRIKDWSPPANIPRILRDAPERIVVCYVETIRTNTAAHPAVVAAQRLMTGQRFHQVVAADQAIPDNLQRYFQLSPADLESAVTLGQFRAAWNQFQNPDDIIAAYNVGTLDSLKIPASRRLVLKSIHLATSTTSLDQRLAEQSIPLSADTSKDRASQRLDNAIAWTRHLQSLCSP